MDLEIKSLTTQGPSYFLTPLYTNLVAKVVEETSLLRPICGFVWWNKSLWYRVFFYNVFNESVFERITYQMFLQKMLHMIFQYYCDF